MLLLYSYINLMKWHAIEWLYINFYWLAVAMNGRMGEGKIVKLKNKTPIKNDWKKGYSINKIVENKHQAVNIS